MESEVVDDTEPRSEDEAEERDRQQDILEMAMVTLTLLRQDPKVMLQQVEHLVRVNSQVAYQVFTTDVWGWTPVHACALRGKKQILQTMLETGIDVNQRMGQPEGLPASCCLLHLAAHRGDEIILDYLLQLGADVKAVDSFGRTPLFYALRAGHHEVVRTLNACAADGAHAPPERYEGGVTSSVRRHGISKGGATTSAVTRRGRDEGDVTSFATRRGGDEGDVTSFATRRSRDEENMSSSTTRHGRDERDVTSFATRHSRDEDMTSFATRRGCDEEDVRSFAKRRGYDEYADESSSENDEFVTPKPRLTRLPAPSIPPRRRRIYRKRHEHQENRHHQLHRQQHLESSEEEV